MLEEIKTHLETAQEKIVASLRHNLSRVRTGRANPNILDGVQVDYYGAPTPLPQVAQISTPEARLLQLQPFDKSMIAEIEKAILGANLGATPSNDGNLIRIPFPALTEEKRKEYVKEVKKYAEDARIAIRNARRDENEALKKAEKNKEITEDDLKRLQEEVQKIIDLQIKEVDALAQSKEEELLQV